MNGRQENDQKIELFVLTQIEMYPEYFEEFYYSMINKTALTKKKYIEVNIKFYKYLRRTNRGTSFDYPEDYKIVTPNMINMYLRSMEAKDTTKERHFYAIKFFFKWLYNSDYIDKNPCDKVDPPKDKEEHPVISLSKEDVEKIKRNIYRGVGSRNQIEKDKKYQQRNLLIFMIGISLGLRISSIIEINISDIDLDKKTLKVTEKGNKVRTIYFSDKLKNYIQLCISERNELIKNVDIDTDALFISANKNRLSKRAAADIISKYTYNLDKHITPHKLRSTCATESYEKSRDIFRVAQKLGHSNIQNTKRYIKVSEEMMREEAEAMDDII